MVYVYLLIGFALLVKGADWFVDGASSIARVLKIPSLIIGLTIVAFGTSMPEVAVSVTGAIEGANDLAVGNIVGSNIFNLLGVVGIAAIISPLSVKGSIISKEFPFALLAAFVLLVLGFDTKFYGYSENVLTSADGIILLCLFGIFMYYLIELALTSRTKVEAVTELEADEENDHEVKKNPLIKSLGMTVLGLAVIVVGGKVVVDSAVEIALKLGMSENLIGLTIVGIGTSLPELVTSVVAALKGESDIALGNVVGSNIFNILFILGVSAMLSDIVINPDVFIDTAIMIVITFVSYLFAISKRQINKIEGGLLVAMYVLYMIFIIYRG